MLPFPLLFFCFLHISLSSFLSVISFFSSVLPPPSVLSFAAPSIISGMDSCWLCLCVGRSGGCRSCYLFHFLQRLREHPGSLRALAGGVGGLWQGAQVSPPVTLPWLNKRGSQWLGLGELPTIHAPPQCPWEASERSMAWLLCSAFCCGRLLRSLRLLGLHSLTLH